MHNIFQILILVDLLFLLPRHVEVLLEPLRLVAVTGSIVCLLIVHHVDCASVWIEEITCSMVLLILLLFIEALIFITVIR